MVVSESSNCLPRKSTLQVYLHLWGVEKRKREREGGKKASATYGKVSFTRILHTIRYIQTLTFCSPRPCVANKNGKSWSLHTQLQLLDFFLDLSWHFCAIRTTTTANPKCTRTSRVLTVQFTTANSVVTAGKGIRICNSKDIRIIISLCSLTTLHCV